MTLRITPFSTDRDTTPRYSFGGPIGMVGGQSGSRIDLSAGGEAHTIDFTENTIVALSPTADCYVRIGQNATADVNTAEPWAAGSVDFRFVRKGERISTVGA